MIKKIITILITTAALLSLTNLQPFIGEENGNLDTNVMIIKGGEEDEGVTLNAINIDGTPYFFLPSGVEEENIVCDFAVDEVCEVMQSANIASIHFFSSDPEKGRNYIHASRDNKAPGMIYMYNKDFELVYKGSVEAIKGRGNATWYNTDKKAYQIKLDKKADLLDPVRGQQKAKKWILLANAYDPTLMRNNMIYAFSKEIGLENSSEGIPVDLYYDGDYRGSYYLCEKPEIGKNRVDIDSLEDEVEEVNPDVDFDALPEVQTVNSYNNTMKYVEGITDPEDITGGYLLELDSAHYLPEKSWFNFTEKQVIVSKSPEYLSEGMMNYISSVFTEMYQYADSQANNLERGSDIFNYLDRDTFARFFIVNELLDVQDAWVSSTFIYKPKGEDKFYAGPVWDCDSSMRLRFTDKRTEGWMRGQLSRTLLQLPEFRKAVQEIYRDEVRPVVYNILLGEQGGTYLRQPSKIRAEIEPSLKMNYMIWDINNNGGNFHPSETVESNYDDMMNWIPARVQWFDEVVLSDDFVPNHVTVKKVKSVSAVSGDEENTCVVRFDKTEYVVNNIFKNKSLEATGYEVAYRVSGTDSWNTADAGNGLEYQIENLSKGTTYDIRARATALHDDIRYYGDYSDVIQFTTESEEEPPVEPSFEGVIRHFGETRFETAVKIADAFKKRMSMEKFDNIIIAYGRNYADALSGSYLSYIRRAPILLVDDLPANISLVQDYIKNNVKPDGRVYLLGGEAVVPRKVVNGLDGFTITRLWGADRYETNLAILREMGNPEEDILVCNGKGFADSLSAAATGKPILLVKDGILDIQVEYLKSCGAENIYIIGGTAAVNNIIETALNTYENVSRIGGVTRYDTSVNVAKAFFADPKAAVLAYGDNFPDGLCGGLLANTMKRPLLLTADGKTAQAVQYVNEKGLTEGAVLGGPALISDDNVKKIFGLPATYDIVIAE